MSIEELGKALIAELKAVTEALDRLESSLVGRASGKPKAELAKEEKPKTETKVVDAAVTEEPKTSPSKEELQQAVEEMPAGNTSYETLRELVLKLASAGKRAEIQAVSKTHGLNAPKDLLKDAADMTSVTDQAKLEAVYADLLALEA